MSIKDKAVYETTGIHLRETTNHGVRVASKISWHECTSNSFL